MVSGRNLRNSSRASASLQASPTTVTPGISARIILHHRRSVKESSTRSSERDLDSELDITLSAICGESADPNSTLAPDHPGSGSRSQRRTRATHHDGLDEELRHDVRAAQFLIEAI